MNCLISTVMSLTTNKFKRILGLGTVVRQRFRRFSYYVARDTADAAAVFLVD
jgi:hypothetical protein